MKTGHILMVVTSHDRIDDDHPTGVWFEEFSLPYGLFRAAGYTIRVASPAGGPAPIDPRSLEGLEETSDNEAARKALADTERLSPTLRVEDFDAIFFPGGHGTMFDLPEHAEVQRLVHEFAVAGRIVAAVCHGPACLVGVRSAAGTPLVRGRRLTAFTDSEERAVELDGRMPFLLEQRLRALGAAFEGADDWQDHVVVDGWLVTGQNPQSSASVTRAVLERLDQASGTA